MTKDNIYSKQEQKTIDLIKNIINSNSDRQFCLAIGMRPDSFSNMKKKGTLPYKYIVDFALKNQISLDYLFQNVFKESKSIENIDENSIKKEDEYIEVINDTKKIKIPLVRKYNNKSDIKAYINKDDIYIIDCSNKELKNLNKYLIKTNSDNYFIKDVEITLTNEYIFKDEVSEPIRTKEDYSKNVEVVGKITEILNRTILR